ncbi:MAG: hypothetical protein QOJ30_1290, partial [Pseudonocardiales bacterium]|nr:hypothetical protein [Pseudonocardiales bacterium]
MTTEQMERTARATRPPWLVAADLAAVLLFAGGLVAALASGVLGGLPLGVRAPFDAAALGLFCVVGAITALDRRMSVLGAVLLGTVSAVGGGVVRDLLTGIVPLALRH